MPVLAKILRANLLLAAQHSIDKHVQNGLIEALKQEKKRRQRGKRLNLIGEEDSGPQLFSPTRVQAARDFQASKNADEADRLQGIADRKVAAAAKKLQKEKKVKKAQNAAIRRQLQAETAAQKAAEKLALQQARQAATELKKQQMETEKMSKTPKKGQKQRRTQAQVVSNDAAAPEVEVVISGTSRTRTIHRPSRYNN